MGGIDILLCLEIEGFILSNPNHNTIYWHKLYHPLNKDRYTWRDSSYFFIDFQIYIETFILPLH